MMAKVIFVLLISCLVEVKSIVIDNEIYDACSCSDVNSKFDSIENMLHARNEKTCRKACPSGFDYLPEVDGCFKVIFQSLTWNRAGEVCRKVMPGVHLVAITSESKQKAIQKYLDDVFAKAESSACPDTLWYNHGKSVWISGQTRTPNQCRTPFFWKTLEAVEIRFNYTNWHAGEPNCYGTGEHCAHLSAGHDYTWNDADCHRQGCALCEF